MFQNENNYELNKEEIKDRKLILKSRPISLIAHLTEKCNLNCPMCVVKKQPWELSDKSLSEIMELIPFLKHVCWSGGEVFLYPKFKELIDEVHKYSNISQAIYTNGLLIDKKWMDELIKGKLTLIFSIDGITKDIYETIRQGAVFEKLLSNLELVNEYKAKSEYEVNLIISVAVMRTNYRQLEMFIDFADKYNIGKIEFGPYIGSNRKENIFKYKDEEIIDSVKQQMQNACEKAKEYKIEFFNRLPYQFKICDKDKNENYSDNLFCTLPWTWLYILPGGKVMPHCHCKKLVGDIEKEAIMDIWNNSRMQLYRKNMINNDFEDWCGEDIHWMDIIERISH